ncbi:hypothetical protein DICVIV_13673 [Dictyocaulus viviparus]|uniref:Uncharacterized protein n=1 Tax=Dictyocaulus viviparus TaxID=29172 RepID=A0A0D8X9R7_DICVI|nr:hypothetical protein DICVIV_13673 [Dictyocaulus viviparus]
MFNKFQEVNTPHCAAELFLPVDKVKHKGYMTVVTDSGNASICETKKLDNKVVVVIIGEMACDNDMITLLHGGLRTPGKVNQPNITKHTQKCCFLVT